VYNWALDTWKSEYEAGGKPSAFKLSAKIKEIKKVYPWLSDPAFDSLQRSVLNLGGAFGKFFKKQARYPAFKKKGQRDSFYLTNQAVKIEGKKLKIPKVGLVNLAQELRLKGKTMSCTISRTADKWFASSKTCSKCGYVHKNLQLDDRSYLCPSCGFEIDRDQNAGINLKNYGLNYLGLGQPEFKPVEKETS
jgi:transposase